MYINLKLEKNIDILSYISKHNSLRPKIVIGFAAETNNLIKNAKKKFMLNDTIEGAELAFEIGKQILKKVNNKKIPLMVDLIKSILNNKKLNIRW